MANEVSVTVGDVRPTSSICIIRRAITAEAMAFGDVVYVSSYSGDIPVVTRADGSALASANPMGVVVSTNDPGATSPASGATVDVVCFGPVTGFDSMTSGNTIWVSDTVGRLSSAVGTHSGIVGYAESPNVVFVRPVCAVMST